MSLKFSTACIVPTLIAVALASYLLGDEPTEHEPAKNQAETPSDREQHFRDRAAAEALRQAVQADTQDENFDVQKYLRRLEEAQQRVDSGRYAEAIEPLQQLVSAARHPSAYLLLGRCFEALEEYDLALYNLSAAMIVPGAAADRKLMSDAYLERGRLYLKLRRNREALDDFTQGVAQDPLNADLLHARGLAQLEAEDQFPNKESSLIHDAIKSFGRAISIDDRHALAYFDRGMARLMLGQGAEAREDLKRAVEVDAQNRLVDRLVDLTAELTRENRELKQNIAAVKAEAEEVTKAGNDLKGQVSEMVDTLRQIRDLLAEPRGLTAHR